LKLPKGTALTEADIELRHLYRGRGKGCVWQVVHAPTGKFVEILTGTGPWELVVEKACRELADLVPPKNVSLKRDWLTSTVKQLAQSIQEESAFERMPILADALEDAGCDNPDVLNHCRSAGEHVRGCWVVDAILDEK